MEKVDALISEIEALDTLSDELENPKPSPNPVKTVEQIVRPEPAPAAMEAKVPDVNPVQSKVEVASVAHGDQLAAERPPIMPVTGKILEDVSSALDLIAVGMQAKIVRSNLQEQADQLGPLSMLLSMVKRAKDQADHLLGRTQS